MLRRPPERSAECWRCGCAGAHGSDDECATALREEIARLRPEAPAAAFKPTGWARRDNAHSIVWHYFENGESICGRRWTDAKPPSVSRVTNGKRCPLCVDRRLRP